MTTPLRPRRRLRSETPRSRRGKVTIASVTAIALIGAGVGVAPAAFAAAPTSGQTIIGSSQSTTVTVPEGAVAMNVTLVGGNGGRGSAQPATGNPGGGGTGDRVTLTNVPVAAGANVTLSGADSGTDAIARNVLKNIDGRPGTGGAGFTTGGSGGPASGATLGNGGGGGGSAAIAVNGITLAVAAGGGAGGGSGGAVLVNGGDGGTSGNGANGRKAFNENNPRAAGGARGATNISSPSNGGGGAAGIGFSASGGGGGAGAGASGGTGGGASGASGGAGGGSGASAAAATFGGKPLSAAISTNSGSTPGSVAVTWVYGASVDVVVPSPAWAQESFTLTVNLGLPGGANPAGRVDVRLNGDDFSWFTASTPTHTVEGTAPRVGTHTLSVTFTPTDTSIQPATWEGPLVVTQRTSTVLMSVSDPAPLAGEPLTLSASVAVDGGASAGGFVSFVDNGIEGVPVPVNQGVASLSWTTLTTGEHSIHAVYRPFDGATHTGGVSNPITIDVQPIPTTLQLDAPATVRAGSAPSFTATLSPAEAFEGALLTLELTSPTGEMTTVVGTVANGRAVIPTAAGLDAGTWTARATAAPMTAHYADATATVAFAVTLSPTFTTLSGPTNVQAQLPVALEATISLTDADDRRSPDGSVTFTVTDATGTRAMLASTQPSSDGTSTSTLTYTPQASGPLTATAAFSETNLYAASSSEAAHVAVDEWATSTTVSLSPRTIRWDESTTANVSVQSDAGAPALSGDVVLIVDGAPVGMPTALVNGAASLPLAAGFSVGDHTVTAAFVDEAGVFAASVSEEETLTVHASTTTTELTVAGAMLTGRSAVLIATTIDEDGAPAHGTVTFEHGAWSLDVATDADGEARVLVPALPAGASQARATFTPSATHTHAGSVGEAALDATAAESSVVLTVTTPAPHHAGEAIDLRALVNSTVDGDELHPRGGVVFHVSGAASTVIPAVLGDNGAFGATFIPTTSGNFTVTAVFESAELGTFTGSASDTVEFAVDTLGVTLAGAVTPTPVTATSASVLRVVATANEDIHPDVPGDEEPFEPVLTLLRSAAPTVFTQLAEATARVVSGTVTLVINGVPAGLPVALVQGSADLPIPAGLPAGIHLAGATFTDPSGVYGNAELAPVSFEITAAHVDPETPDNGGTDGETPDNGGNGGVTPPSEDTSGGSGDGDKPVTTAKPKAAQLPATGSDAPAGLLLIAGLLLMGGVALRIRTAVRPRS